jgi:hypothetical protein
MKKVISMTAVLVLVCFATMAFAADAVNPLDAAKTATQTAVTKEAVKAASGEVIVGKIKKIDTKANTIVIDDKTITVKAEQLKELKKGEKVKVNLATGTMNAESIIPMDKKAAKKAAKKEAKKAEDEAIQSGTQKAVEKLGQ